MNQIKIEHEDIYQLFSLMFRDHTASKYKTERSNTKGKCPLCNKRKHQIQAIHKIGKSRKELVKKIIDDLLKKDETINAADVKEKYINIHKKEAIIVIGCRKCHSDYDKGCLKIDDSSFIKAK